jgi:hypothetical protein
LGLIHGRIADDLDPVGELHTQDQFWQLIVAVDPAPTFLGALDKPTVAPGCSYLIVSD